MKMSKVCILGAGVMGHSIGQVFASKGYRVVLRDIQDKYLQDAKKEIERRINRDVSRGRLGEDEAQSILGRISYSMDLGEALEGAALVIEAIPEILDLKKRVLSEVSEVAEKDTVPAQCLFQGMGYKAVRP